VNQPPITQIQNSLRERVNNQPVNTRIEVRSNFYQEAKSFFNQTSSAVESTLQRAARQLSAVVLDRNGRTTHKMYSKQELSESCGCSLRDLRNIDPDFRYAYPVFVARRNAIIVCVEHFKAILLPDKILLFGFNNPEVSIFVGTMKQQIYVNKENLPFELLALETMLGRICKFLNTKLDDKRPIIMEVLSHGGLNSGEVKLFQPRLKQLYPIKAFLNEMQSVAQEIRRAIYDVLVSDEDMSAMYLTAKAMDLKGRSNEIRHHIEVEEIFENYLMQIEFLASDVQEYQNSIRSTEELVEIELDVMRNRILQVELILSVSGFFVTWGALITGLFGMNLLSGLEDHHSMFYWVSLFLFSGGGAAFAATIWYCKRQKIL